EQTDRRDQHWCLDAPARPGFDAPQGASFIEACGRDFGVEADMWTDVLFRDHAPDVVEYFGLWREHRAPFVILVLGVRIDARDHVACRAGIRIVAPHAADFGRAFQHDEAALARASQRHRHGDAAETGADDNDGN